MTAASAPEALPRLWDMIHEAGVIDGARALHLAVGRPPLVRVQEEGLRPLRETLPPIDAKSIIVLLCGVIDPERWDAIESVGDGEMILSRGLAGRPITLNVFRNSESWSAVVHL
ncbi:hypothetical protein IT570_12815 [Candidatus Sumerlaeota bacterium]|nr:hypothetical protein [Candidatus Sumerlaeota bacterium]